MNESITGITSMATRQLLRELTQTYEARTGHRVDLQAAGGVDVARRIQQGEPFDFVVLARQAIDGLAAAGHVDADTRVGLARSPIALAVAAGARKPPLRSA